MTGNLDGLGYRGAAVLMTGGASGLGQAAARLLGEWGATVHIADIAEPTAPHASFTRLDLADFDGVRGACAKLRDQIGAVDFLFPIAGIPPNLAGPLHCMVVNYAGTRLFTEEMLPIVKEGGAVGLIASTAGRYWQNFVADHLETLKISRPEDIRRFFEAHPDKLRDGYSPSKELLIVWVQQIALELAKRRIRINTIAPCPIATPFMEEAAKSLGQEFIDNYPYPLLGRMASAEEQALSLLLLSSPLNAAVTGTTLMTDQGYAGGLVTGVLEPARPPSRAA